MCIRDSHKTLPLPSYVRVTNLDNDKQAIVRVNDRGPFHDNRIIDLSYAAAVKLGYHNKGTAKVKIEVIHFDPENNVTVGVNPTVSYDEYIGIAPLPSALASTSPVTPSSEVAASTSAQSDNLQQTSISLDGYFIQVAALSNQKKAESISNVLSALYQVPTHMPVVGNVYKLQLGPIEDEALAHELLEQLKQNGYPQAYKIKQTL